MIPISQAPLTFALVLWIGVAIVATGALAAAHKDGMRRPFFRRRPSLYWLLWIVVVPVVAPFLILNVLTAAALVWILIVGS